MATNAVGDDEKVPDAGKSTQDDSKDDGKNKTAEHEMSEDRRLFLLDYFSKALGISTAPKPESLVDEVSFEGIARYIASDKCKKIVTMAGAGISTSAGIPDFRSPGTGLYDNLKKYNLPDPTAAFNVDYFKENPEPFYLIRKEMFGKTYKPTPSHYFIELLEKKNKLSRHFTQNVDGLERKTGLSSDKLIEAHGSISTGHCQECKHVYSHEWISDRVFDKTAQSPVPKCSQPKCNGVIRPDIVMFGESLPKRFAENVKDLDDCDCLIVMGTSLVVQPFASITSRTKDNVPRLYMNMEKTGSGPAHPLTALIFGGGFNFDAEDNIRDVFRQGATDEGCYALADIIGWGDELREMVKQGHEKLDEQFGTPVKSQSVASSKPAGYASVKCPTHGKPQSGQGADNKVSSQGQNKVTSKTPNKATSRSSVKKPTSATTKGCKVTNVK